MQRQLGSGRDGRLFIRVGLVLLGICDGLRWSARRRYVCGDEIAFDRKGDLYEVEMPNHIVRKIDAASGLVRTIAGTGQPGARTFVTLYKKTRARV